MANESLHRMHSPLCMKGKCGKYSLTFAYAHKSSKAVLTSGVVCQGSAWYEDSRLCNECMIETAERLRNECMNP